MSWTLEDPKPFEYVKIYPTEYAWVCTNCGRYNNVDWNEYVIVKCGWCDTMFNVEQKEPDGKVTKMSLRSLAQRMRGTIHRCIDDDEAEGDFDKEEWCDILTDYIETWAETIDVLIKEE